MSTQFIDAIQNFIEDLYKGFGRQQDSLSLFYRLIQRLKNNPDAQVQQTICNCVERFIAENEEAIRSKDVTQLKSRVLVFKGRINIKFNEIFPLADTHAQKSIWNHLAVLLAIQNNEVDELLKELKEEDSSQLVTVSDSVEEKFLDNLLAKFMPSPDATEPPQLDMMSMMNTVQSMFEGEQSLDPQKLLMLMGQKTQSIVGQMSSIKQ